MRDAEYFMTPQADLGSSCVEAKILRRINDALTTAITAHDIKGPGVFVRKRRGLFFGGWRWILSTIGWFTEASDSLSVWDGTWCYLYPSLHLCPPLTRLSLWSTAVCIGTGLNNLRLFRTKATQNNLGRKGYGCFAPPPVGVKWLQIFNPHVQYTFKCAHTECKMSHDSPRLCFLRLPEKLCSHETNCCVALALQWRMKVHRARQTSIPLQPPLSNKHIYYSGWARLEVSPHTPPTRRYPGQWDSGCTTLGISTRNEKKKKTNGPPTFSSRRGIKGHSHCLHTWRKSLFIRWCFMIFLQPCWDWEQSLFHHHFLLWTWAWHHFHRDSLLNSLVPLYHSD